MKYVKRNAIAGRAFDSFAQLETHLAEWMRQADRREHETMREAPHALRAHEPQVMWPLPAGRVRVRDRRLRRRVSNALSSTSTPSATASRTG